MSEPQNMFDRAGDIFDAAIHLPATERVDFVEQVCGEDHQVCSLVKQMLDGYQEPRAVDAAASTADPVRGAIRCIKESITAGLVSQELPEKIGNYTVLGILGHGGMGTVYRAQQLNPSRMVALKVIRAGLTSLRTLRRFEHETEVLGRLQHPGIAQIYEAGTHETGVGPQPFFAMELVEGTTLADHATARNLNTRQRLQLFCCVCDAVQYSPHMKGVIHRDLKPANILVEERPFAQGEAGLDSLGRPKVLDFGVARLTDVDTIGAATVQTNMGQLVGTIPFMSPEQVSGDTADLDTRSDVYALGVVLFVLLSGEQPHKLEGKPVADAIRIIRNNQPTRLSGIDTSLRGDIETIVGKAMEKERQHRYQSVADLGSDIHRYLNDEPISARPPSTWYHLTRFVRRRKELVSAVAAVFIVLAVGVVATSSAVIIARDRQHEKERAFTAAEVFTRMFGAITSVYSGTRSFEDAEPDLLSELDRLRQTLGDESPQTVAAMNTIGYLYWNRGAMEKAESMYTAVYELTDRVYGDAHENTATSANNLGSLRKERGDLRAAEQLFRRAFEIQSALAGRTDPIALEYSNNLAAVLFDLEEFEEAEGLYRGVIEVFEQSPDVESLAFCVTNYNLGELLNQTDRAEMALPLLATCVDAAREVLDPESWILGLFLIEYSECLGHLKRFSEAEVVALEGHSILAAAGSPKADDAAATLVTLYDAWDESDPVQGYDAQADQWRARLLLPAKLDTSTKPHAANPAEPDGG